MLIVFFLLILGELWLQKNKKMHFKAERKRVSPCNYKNCEEIWNFFFAVLKHVVKNLQYSQEWICRFLHCLNRAAEFLNLSENFLAVNLPKLCHVIYKVCNSLFSQAKRPKNEFDIMSKNEKIIFWTIQSPFWQLPHYFSDFLTDWDTLYACRKFQTKKSRW